MMDILPRFSEAALLTRVKHLQPFGTEVIILRPQGVSSLRSKPDTRHNEITNLALLAAYSRYPSPDVALVELTLKVIRSWINEDPLMWCQYGAKFKVEKSYDLYKISLYPFSENP